jgi:glutamate racemase
VALRYLVPFTAGAVDTLVLGCTHYPLLREVIAEVVGPEVTLIDSADAVSEQAHASLARAGQLGAGAPAAGEHRFFVTDDPAPFQDVAQRFLGSSLAIELCRLPV